MQEIELIQGSPEWHAHRAKHFNASDAPAMMGVSSYKSRSELIKELATGVIAEIDPATQRRFDDGHRFEALARPVAEKIIGEDLYPKTGVNGKYSASFDGLTMDDSIAFEHKSLNDAIRACITASDLPIQYRVQIEQQFLVSGATRCLFMASKWNDDDTLADEKHFWVEPDLELRAKIIAGWAQLEADVANYQPSEDAPVVKAVPIADLPALTIEISGHVLASNLPQWQETVTARIQAINTELLTDQHFVDAEKTVKFLEDGEKRLDLVKSQALAQTASIDELFRAIDTIKAEMRSKRLELDRTIKARKDSIRIEIVTEGKAALQAHIDTLNKRIGENYMPAIATDFAAAIKGKRTVASVKEAVKNELVRATIEASTMADRIQINLNALDAVWEEYAGLFADIKQIVTKAEDDFAALIKSRITDYRDREAKRRADAEATAAAARAVAAQNTPSEQPASVSANVGIVATPDLGKVETTPVESPRIATGSGIIPPAVWTQAKDNVVSLLSTLTIAELGIVADFINRKSWKKAA